MSALFRAELSNLQRLVARHAAEQTANTNERERMRTHIIKQRVTRLQVPCKRLAKNNRATILQTLRKHASERNPMSANKVSEMTGITDDTTRKHLRDLASEGEATAVVSPSGKQVRYYATE